MTDRACFLPVILGSDENAYGCARLFFERYGVKSQLYCATPLAATSYSRILTRCVVQNLDEPSVFKNTLPLLLADLKTKYGKLLLIPCSDYYTELCVEFQKEICFFVENRFITPECFHLFSDKASFARLCKSMKIPHPKTVISTPSELFSTPTPFAAPLVIKPNNSNSSAYLHADFPGKKKVYICQNEDEYRCTLSVFSDFGYDGELVVQEYIPGESDDMFTINAYCDKNGRVRLIGAAQVIAEYKSASSIGNYIALRTQKNRELCEKAIKILEDLRYVGFANFDIKRDPRSGEFLFFELNPRQGRSSYFIHTAGENLMEAMVSDIILDKPYSLTFAEKEGLWGALPQKSISQMLGSNELVDFSLDFPRDRSVMRRLMLARRAYFLREESRQRGF